MSTILKKDSAGKVLRRLATVDLADHLREADSIIETARRRAAALLARSEQEARRSAEETRKAAYEEGFRKGVEEGTQRGLSEALSRATERFRSEHAHLVSDLEQAVAQFAAMKDELRLSAQRDLLDFAVRLASKLTFAIGSLHREAAVENVKRALEFVGRSTNLRIRLNAADLATMETFATDALRQIAGSSVVAIEKDDSMAPGGCVVQTEHTEIDARLETQVDELVALLLGAGHGHG